MSFYTPQEQKPKEQNYMNHHIPCTKKKLKDLEKNENGKTDYKKESVVHQH